MPIFKCELVCPAGTINIPSEQAIKAVKAFSITQFGL